MTWGAEILLKESKIEVEDDVLGIIDTPKILGILEWVQGLTFYKRPGIDEMKIEHTNMIRYWNFILSRE